MKPSDTDQRTTAKKAKRVQLDLPPSSYDRLQRLVEATEATSAAEVIRNALRIYQKLLARQEEGCTLMVQQQDGTLKQLRVPDA